VNDVRKDGCGRVGIGVGMEIGKRLGEVGVSWHICQDAQCAQIHPIGPSQAKSCQVTCHLSDERD
jgi:hypothetical protein